MIFDCFTFYNELELLEVRLNILKDVVDKFVLLESTITYTSEKKPLFFEKNKARYKQFKDKIIHVVVRDTPEVSNPWLVEHFLMAAAIRGLGKARANDTILVSNLDEIPRPEKILEWKDKKGKLKGFEQQFFYYYLNFVCTNRLWVGTKMLKFGDLPSFSDAYIVRHARNNITIPSGGWHFSYMGGLDRIRDKIATGTHQEYNNNNYNTKERILQSIIQKKDAFGHGDKFDFVPIKTLPKYIINNQDRYRDMFLAKDKMRDLKKQNLKFLEFKHKARLLYRTARSFVKGLNPKKPRRMNISEGVIEKKSI